MKDNAKLMKTTAILHWIAVRFLSKLANLKYYDIVIQIFKYFWVSLLAAIADFTLFMALYEWIGVWYIAANTAGFALGGLYKLHIVDNICLQRAIDKDMVRIYNIYNNRACRTCRIKYNSLFDNRYNGVRRWNFKDNRDMFRIFLEFFRAKIFII